MGYVLTGTSKLICPHGGDVRHYSKSMDVPYIQGSPVCLMSDGYDILTCPVPGKFRCQRIEWQTGSVMTVNGSQVLTHLSIGHCYTSDSLLTGIPIILDHQKEYLAEDKE